MSGKVGEKDKQTVQLNKQTTTADTGTFVGFQTKRRKVMVPEKITRSS